MLVDYFVEDDWLDVADGERKLIVGHCPKRPQVSGRRTKIGQADGRFAARPDMDDLVAASMSARHLCADARYDFHVAIDDLHQSGWLERREVIGIIGTGQLGNVAVGIIP